jgi:hypothetical protein
MWFARPSRAALLVRQIHASPSMAVIAVTGAGARAIAWLFAESGASRTVLDARIPYSVAALDEYVGSRAEQHVSEAEARMMADRSYWRALQLLAADRPAEPGKAPVLGLGCTATIATDRPKKGDHRCHVAIRTAGDRTSWSLTMVKGARDRNGEEEVVSRIVLNALAGGCAIGAKVPIALKGGEEISESREAVADPIALIAAGEGAAVTVEPDGRQMEGAAAGQVVLAGSFNPLHEGHLRLANVAAAMTGKPVVFEISIANVAKPDLGLPELHARLAQFLGRHRVVVTRAPTFVGKARVLSGATFVVGYDTAVRLFDKQYYPPYDPSADPDRAGSAAGAALGQLLRSGARFLVAGRLTDGVYRTVGDIKAPPQYRGLLEAIPEARFRADVSSTEIREGKSVNTGV